MRPGVPRARREGEELNLKSFVQQKPEGRGGSRYALPFWQHLIFLEIKLDKSRGAPHLCRREVPPMSRLPVEILTPAEVLSLIGASSAACPTGIRNRALLTILYRTGIRLAEALALRTKDVNLDAGTLAVLHGKGDKMRVVGLEPGAAAVLSAWLAQRTALGLNGQQPIFCTLKGAAILQSYIRPLMKRLAGRAGIEKRVHAHGLRHTLAAELASEGVPVNVIQKHLGHTSLATTATYLDHIAPAAVIRATAGRGWVLA